MKELERVIKDKKQAVKDADLELTKLEHDMQVLAKEAAAATNLVANLEKQHEWIAEEKEFVIVSLSAMNSDGRWIGCLVNLDPPMISPPSMLEA